MSNIRITKANNPRLLGGSTKMLSLKEVSDRLGIPLSTVRKRYATDWALPYYKVGRHVLVMEREFQHWLETHRVA